MSDIVSYQVILSDPAKAMLIEHVTFLSQVSIPAANRLIVSLEKAMNSLKEYPQRCAIYQTNQTSGKYKRLIVGRYAILFVIEEKAKIYRIRYILDTRRDNK